MCDMQEQTGDILLSHIGRLVVSGGERNGRQCDDRRAPEAQAARLHVFGSLRFRPDGLSTVKVDEKERFEEIKERLRIILENQIVQFR